MLPNAVARQGPSTGGAPDAAAPIDRVAPVRGGDPVSLAGLAACVDEARRAATSRTAPPPDPTAFAVLRARLRDAAARLPPSVRDAVARPLVALLDELGARGFAGVLLRDPGREGEARLLLDLAQAVLQRGEGYASRATAAFQEVVSDLYDGFLSAEDRRGVKPPDHGVTAPVVRWGDAETGPYTWPATATEAFGVQGALVSLPAAHATSGLLAWPALAHETAGHDVLGADDGLREELAAAVRREVLAAGLGAGIAGYWAERIDESASDVLGVLNMGPAAAVGMVGYFRALNGAWRGTAQLRNVGLEEDSHPADIARAWLAAETVRLLSFRGAGRWADALVVEADRDLGKVRLGDLAVPAEVARASTAAVARAVVRTRLRSLEGKSLGEIQDWKDGDEAVAQALRARMRPGGTAGTGGEGRGGARRGPDPAGAYAAHAVAAAVYEAASGDTPPEAVMPRMVSVLAEMHARNPDWQGIPAPGSSARV
jgi:hypothetical protein